MAIVPIDPIQTFSEPLPNILTQPPETFTLRANVAVNEWNSILIQMNDRFAKFNNNLSELPSFNFQTNVAWATYSNSPTATTLNFNIANMSAATDAIVRLFTNTQYTLPTGTLAGRHAAGTGRVQAVSVNSTLSFAGGVLGVNVANVVSANSVDAAIQGSMTVPYTLTMLVSGNDPSTGAVVANVPFKFEPQVNWLGFEGAMAGARPYVKVNVNRANLAAYLDSEARPLTGSGLTLPAVTLAGRWATSTGVVQSITLSNNLTLSGTGQLDVSINNIGTAIDARVRSITATALTLPGATLAGRWNSATGAIQAIGLSTDFQFTTEGRLAPNVPVLGAALDNRARPLTNANLTMPANTLAGRSGDAGKIQTIGLTSSFDFSAEGNLVLVGEFAAPIIDFEERPLQGTGYTVPALSLVGRWSEEDGKVQNIEIGEGLEFTGSVLKGTASLNLPSGTLAGRQSLTDGAAEAVQLGSTLWLDPAVSIGQRVLQVQVSEVDAVSRPIVGTGYTLSPNSLVGNHTSGGAVERIQVVGGLQIYEQEGAKLIGIDPETAWNVLSGEPGFRQYTVNAGDRDGTITGSIKITRVGKMRFLTGELQIQSLIDGANLGLQLLDEIDRPATAEKVALSLAPQSEPSIALSLSILNNSITWLRRTTTELNVIVSGAYVVP